MKNQIKIIKEKMKESETLDLGSTVVLACSKCGEKLIYDPKHDIHACFDTKCVTGQDEL